MQCCAPWCDFFEQEWTRFLPCGCKKQFVFLVNIQFSRSSAVVILSDEAPDLHDVSHCNFPGPLSGSIGKRYRVAAAVPRGAVYLFQPVRPRRACMNSRAPIGIGFIRTGRGRATPGRGRPPGRSRNARKRPPKGGLLSFVGGKARQLRGSRRAEPAHSWLDPGSLFRRRPWRAPEAACQRDREDRQGRREDRD